jgi:Ala-tRNA(Pro) deacylase
MAIASTLKWYLEAFGADYEVLPHPHSSTSFQTARAARVPKQWLAKAVVLEDEKGYVMAILPTSNRIAFDALEQVLERRLKFATEEEIGKLFRDCEMGAIPPLGCAYGIQTVIDDSLLRLPQIYFEAGDHEDVVHMSGEQFCELVEESTHGRFSRHT